MKITTKRAISILLTLLMCLSLLTGIVLPAAAEDIETDVIDPYANINATDDNDDDVFVPGDNVVFVDPAFGKDPYDGEFEYTYGDGETWGNGVTYELTYGVNAFGNLYEGIYAARDEWNAFGGTVEEYDSVDTVVVAPGTYAGNQWQQQEWPTYNLPSDWENGSYDELFTVTILGPQAGVSPVTDEIDHANPIAQNGRSTDPTKEAVSTSTMWEALNVQYVVDGFAFTQHHNFFGGYNAETPYSSQVFKNIYHYIDQVYRDNSGYANFRGSGLAASRNMEFVNYYLKYAQLNDPKGTANNKIISTRLIMDNFYEDTTEIEFVTDQYNQGYQIQAYLQNPTTLREGFLGEGVTGSHWEIRNSTINTHPTNHWLRFQFNDGCYKTAAAGTLNITFEDNLFYNAGDMVRSIYGGKDPATTADPTGYGDIVSFQGDWTMENKGAFTFTFERNTLEYTQAAMSDAYDGNGGTMEKTTGGTFFNIHLNNLKDINNQFVNWNLGENTLIFPSTSKLTGRRYLMAASSSSGESMVKNDVWDYSHLMLNEKGEVCTFWPSYHTVNDVYAGDDFAGGVRELFTVVDGADMAIAENNIEIRAANDLNGIPIAGFEGNVTIVPQNNAGSYAADELFKFRGEKVEVVKLLDKDGQEVSGKVNPKDIDGYKLVAKYQTKTTTCNVTLTINIASEDKYAFIDPTGAVTSYEFNGKTYTLDATNRWNNYLKESYTAIKSAKKNVVVFLPGEYTLDNYQFQYDAALLGPQFGVSPVGDGFALNAARDGIAKTGENAYTVDTKKEAYFTGGLWNVYYTEAAVYMDGFSFSNTEINLQSANYDWGYAKNGSLVSLTLKNSFVNGWDATFLGAWGGTRMNTIAKQAMYVSDIYAAGLGATDSKPFMDVGAMNVEIDHCYFENKQTSCLVRTAGSNGARMPVHSQVGTFRFTNCKATGINDTYNFLYPNFANHDANNTWAGTPYSADAKYFPGGFEIVFDNNIFENIYSVSNPPKTWMVRPAVPDTDAYLKLQFTNNTLSYDTVPVPANLYFYNPSAGIIDEHIIEGNVILNANNIALNTGVELRDGSVADLDNNYWAQIVDGKDQVVSVKLSSSDGGSKSNWFWLDREMTVKTKDLILVDNNYDAYEEVGYVGSMNEVKITKNAGADASMFKAADGAAVAGVYSDENCTQALTSFAHPQTVYVKVTKGEYTLINKVELTCACDHVGNEPVDEILVEATCKANGAKNVKCGFCGTVLEENVEIPKGKHTVSEELIVLTPATCGEKGVGKKVCTVCGEDAETNIEIPATGAHTEGELVVDTPATCTAAGKGHKSCSTCGTLLTDNIEIPIDPEAHKWEAEYTVDVEPTCGKDGSKSIYCEYCETQKADSVTAVPATGNHTEDVENVIVDTPPTCGEEGVGHTVCSVCGETVNANVSIAATGNHEADEQVVADIPATCITAGVGHTVCKVCGDVINENVPIAATGIHVPANEWTKGEDKHYHACTTPDCDAKLDEADHVAGDVIVDTASTCVAQGVGHKDCATCGKTMEENVVIPATGKHTPGEWKVVKEATTTATGLKEQECTVCHTKLDEQIIPKKASPVKFNDVKKSDYYYDAVTWAVANGVTTGTGKGAFSPDDSCTRAQAVTFLWRAAGQPAPKGTKNPFKDVKKSDYYYKAVLWAAENGVTSGTTATTFSPDEVCTRGQIVTFQWRALGGAKKVSGTNPFKDVKKSDYFYNAVLWAVKNKVTSGTTATTFEPEANCTRGQIVTFLYRAVEK